VSTYATAGPVRRALRSVVTLGPVAWASARVLPGADRLVARASGGRATLSGWVTGLPIVELETVGARSGEARRHRVMAVPDAGGLLVVAANFGADRHPAWYFNARAERRVRVDGRAYVARELAGAERQEGFDRALALNPGWRRFSDRAGRPIPVLALTPDTGSA
jgi:deazaflavin-dependent oxidoreductase (nitroreductase family)